MIKYAIPFFLIPATVATVLTGLIYFTGQSIYRQSANDPQVQMVDEAISILLSGQALDPQRFSTKTTIGSSLTSYLVVYNSDKEPVLGSAEYNNALPTPPSAVFDTAKAEGEFRTTWEPNEYTRQALVVRYFDKETESGYVLAGRSLREVDSRSWEFTQNVVIAWIVLLAVLLAESLAFGKISHSRHR